MNASESDYRYHKPLPTGVRGAGKEGGKRYLFAAGELLVRRADYDDDTRFRGLRQALDDAGAKPYDEWLHSQSTTESALPKDLHEVTREIIEAKRHDRRRLAQAGLEANEVLRFVIPRLKDPKVLDNDIPDVIDGLQKPQRDIPDAELWPIFPNVMLAGEEDDGVFGPAKAAAPMAKALPRLRNNGLGRGVRVAVIDTGVRADHIWLKNRCTVRGKMDHEVLDAAPPFQERDYEAGHGTFVAGVIARIAPAATIVVRGVLDSNGLIDDATLAGAIDDLQRELPLHILNLSLGGYLHGPLPPQSGGNASTARNTALQPDGLPASGDAIKRLQKANFDRHGKHLIVVAAAGNNNSDEPFYPAALPFVIGVGSIDKDGNRSAFSNHGEWVDTEALGEDVESSFVGPFPNEPGGGGQRNEGASWSGTSFAAPRISGYLAAAMTVYPGNE
jgi:subtilisin family serine protease